MNNSNLKIPDILKNNIIYYFAMFDPQCLQNLPQFISYYEKLWEFKAGDCFSDAQFNIVLNAKKQDGEQVVFKCCVPNKEFKTEVKSLEHFNGIGAVKLLKSDIENGAMLIEKINPGTLLEKCALSVEEETLLAVSVYKKLHKPIEKMEVFPTLTDWFEGFDQRLTKKFGGTPGPFSKKIVEKSAFLSHELLTSQTNTVLLHGDLHYANLLLSNKGYVVAIDSKGVVGESEFEIPLPRVTNPITKKELLYRLDCFIEQSQFDKKRIYSWVFCKAVLAAWWTVEDAGAASEFTQKFLNVAEITQNFL